MSNKLQYTDTLPKFMETCTNPKKATNKQWEWLKSHGCLHRHSFATHFNCFVSQYGVKERIGFLDIEATNLKANFGIVLCWCILDNEGNLYEDWLTKDDIKEGTEDKRVVSTCIEVMNTFDRVVGHYSTYYDIPFLRTRALIHGLEFPGVGELYHTDCWKMAKKSLCIHSNRQDVVAEAILGKTVKTRIDQKAWRLAAMGYSDSMKEVVDHCQKDVADLRANFNKLLPFVKLTRTSV